PGLAGSGEQRVGTLGAQPVGLGEAAVEVLEVAQPGQCGRLVDDRVRLGLVTAARTAAGSSRSSTTGSAPSARSCWALPGVWTVPVTSWPWATRWGTSRAPIAPLAPATKTRTLPSSWSSA